MEGQHPTYTIVTDPKEADAVGWGFHTNDVSKPAKVYFKFPEMKSDELRIKVHYAGLCYSEVHTVREDWGPIKNRPIIPGHEIAGEVTHVGADVSDFKVGDIVGFGCFRDHCGECRPCKKSHNNHCQANLPQRFTYGELFWGGYATGVQHPAKWFYKIPSGLDLNKVAPLFCAGITLFAPIARHCKKGDRVAVNGLGGLGHLGLMYAKAWGCHVTCLTTSKDKIDLCKQLGADEVVITTEPGAWDKVKGSFDVLLNTVSHSDTDTFNKLTAAVDALGTYVQLGGAVQPIEFRTMSLLFGQKNLTGSLVGSYKETVEMLEFSDKHHILPMTEEFSFDDFPKAWDLLVNGKPKFRCVVKCLDGK